MTKHCGWVPLLVVLALVASSPLGTAGDNKAAQKIFDKMIDAIKVNNRDAFVADATEDIKKGTTQEVMDALNKVLGTRLKKGVEITYLCQLKQAEHQVYLWKLAFKDGGDDVVVRIALKEGKVGGFFLQ